MGEGTSGTRRSIVTTVLTFVIATMAMAAGASVSSHPNAAPSAPLAPSAERTRGGPKDAKDAAAAHGGPIERVHEAAACNLSDATGLPAKWTHGDYVRAVARSGKDHAVREAARSACGKPVAAAAHGKANASEDAHGNGRSEAGQHLHGNGHGAVVSAEHRADGHGHDDSTRSTAPEQAVARRRTCRAQALPRPHTAELAPRLPSTAPCPEGTR